MSLLLDIKAALFMRATRSVLVVGGPEGPPYDDWSNFRV